MNHEKYMKVALVLAMKSMEQNEVPIGAVIVKNDKIIARAYNKKESNNSVLKHAELIAIEKASKKLKNWRLNDCIMYVTLEPCPMCASAIQQARIKTVIYGARSDMKENSQITSQIFLSTNANNKVECCGQILEDQCSKLLKDFFAQKR